MMFPIKQEIWDKSRQSDGSIDLLRVFGALYGDAALTEGRRRFLNDIDAIKPIQSRQAATVAVATAYYSVR